MNAVTPIYSYSSEESPYYFSEESLAGDSSEKKRQSMRTKDLEYANELNAEHAESAKETQRGTAGSVASNCKQHLPPFAFKKLMYNETNPLKETLHSRNHKQQTNIPFPLQASGI